MNKVELKSKLEEIFLDEVHKMISDWATGAHHNEIPMNNIINRFLDFLIEHRHEIVLVDQNRPCAPSYIPGIDDDWANYDMRKVIEETLFAFAKETNMGPSGFTYESKRGMIDSATARISWAVLHYTEKKYLEIIRKVVGTRV